MQTASRTAADAARGTPGRNGEDGMALLLAIATSALLTGIGLGLLLLTDVELTTSSNHRDAAEVFHAADGGIDRSLQELASIANWSDVLAGGATSGVRSPLLLPGAAGGTALDAAALTDEVQRSAFGVLGVGPDTPRWRLFGHGPAGDLFSMAGLPDRVYILTWVADDAADADGDPQQDTNGVLIVRVRAIGVRGSRCDIQAVVARSDTPGVLRKVSWRAVR